MGEDLGEGDSDPLDPVRAFRGRDDVGLELGFMVEFEVGWE